MRVLVTQLDRTLLDRWEQLNRSAVAIGAAVVVWCSGLGVALRDGGSMALLLPWVSCAPNRMHARTGRMAVGYAGFRCSIGCRRQAVLKGGPAVFGPPCRMITEQVVSLLVD